MAGEDNGTMIGNWTPNPSPRTFVLNFLNEDIGSRSFSDLLAENGAEVPPPESEKKTTITSSKEEEGNARVQFPENLSFDFAPFDMNKSSSRGGLTERMAARGAFNAPKLNTAQLRSADMTSTSADIRSPYLTIPPGLSPTTLFDSPLPGLSPTMLLDSPVFLCDSLAQPSPTTGKFLFGQSNNYNSVMAVPDQSKDHPLEEMAPEAFAFKPHISSSSSYFSSAENKVVSTIGQQHAQSEHPVNFQNQQEFNLQTGFTNSSERKDAAADLMISQRRSDPFTGNEHSPPSDDGEADGRGELSLLTTGAPSEDGWNWRKYGQKQVKGSEYPRSYYKCTHPNCMVKKKVERSHEGHITEIIYKGAHNHAKPLPNRRSGAGSSQPFDGQLDGSELPDSKPFLTHNQNGTGGHEWRSEGLEATPSASVAAELCDPCDPSTSMQVQDGQRFESSDPIDVSSTVSNDEDEDDRVTHGSVSLGCDGDGDETESKRMKLDTCAVEMSAASRAVREPRVVVQTTSEVDILDDGYRWRKYGQKVVKGNPNPRSYYKCTNPGCTVRKHVERASHDLKSVITTYEGKHNHEVPAARNSGSHASSIPMNANGTSASQAHSLHRRPDPNQDSLMRFDGRAAAALGPFGIPGREQQLGQAPSFAFGMPQRGLSSLGMAGLSSAAQFRIMGHHHQNQRPTNESGFVVPKGEPKEEPMSSESGMPMSNSASSVYHQMMGRLPLEPQL